MTEAEYQESLAKVKQLVLSIRDFPAHEFKTFADAHHPEDKYLALKMWVLYLEAD